MILGFLRKKKTMKRIIWGIAIIIIPAFVIWGAGSSDKDKGPDCAGKVFNRKVPFHEYKSMWLAVNSQITRSGNTNVPADVIDQAAWTRILLLEAAKKNRIKISDQDVGKLITSLPVFQRDGGFDKGLYRSMLGESVKAFEERVRDDIAIANLRQQVTSGISLTEEEVADEYKKRNEKIEASYIQIRFDDHKENIKYERSDLIGFYDKNKELFRKPESIDLKYILFSKNSVKDDISIDEKQIEDYFEKNKETFKEDKEELEPLLDEALKKIISDRLYEKERLNIAEDTAYKALDEALGISSVDKAASVLGLEPKETGLFGIQDKVPGIGLSAELSKIGFSLEKDEVYNRLVKIEDAFYVIQLKDKKKSFIPDLENIEDNVADEYIRSESIKIANENAISVYDSINKKIAEGVEFDIALGELGLEKKGSGLIGRDGYIAGLGPAETFIEASSYLKVGELSSPIKMLDSWAIARLERYEPIDPEKYEKEKQDFGSSLVSRKQEQVFREWLEDFKGKSGFVSFTAE